MRIWFVWFLFPLSLFAQAPSASGVIFNQWAQQNPSQAKTLQKDFYNAVASFSQEEQAVLDTLQQEMLKKRVPNASWEQLAQVCIGYAEHYKNKLPAKNWLYVILSSVNKGANKNDFPKLLGKFAGLFHKDLLFENVQFSWKMQSASLEFTVQDYSIWLSAPEADLILASKDQKSVLTNVKNLKIHFNDDKLSAEEGKYTLQRVGLSADKNFVLFNKLQINLKQNQFSTDSSRLICQFSKDTLFGSFKERVPLSKINAQEETYPFFRAQGKKITIDPIFVGLDASYEGGFSLIGNRFWGTDLDGEPFVLTFKRDEKPFVKVYGNFLENKGGQLQAGKVKAVFYLPKDSLVYSVGDFQYFDKRRRVGEPNRLFLLKPTLDNKKVFLQDSYHGVDIATDSIVWQVDEAQLSFRSVVNPQNPQYTRVFSRDYFLPELYDNLSIPNDVHPFIQLRRVADFYGKKFTITEFSKFYKINEKVALPFLEQMQRQGFLGIDESGNIAVEAKVYNYLDYYYQKKDYDQMGFLLDKQVYKGLKQVSSKKLLKSFNKEEINPKQDASIDLEDLSLKMYGINQVWISKTRKVGLYPKTFSIEMLENRNFRTRALWEAGMFSLYADSLSYFDYDNFKVEMPTVDSMRFNTLSFSMDLDTNKRRGLRRVKNAIHQLKGNIEIDLPNNKSGVFVKTQEHAKHTKTQYPIFHNLDSSFVYYEKLQNGISYDKAKFHFKLDPFVLDNMQEVDPDRFFLLGKFYSADILEPFRINVGIQADYALGTFIKMEKELLAYPKAGKSMISGEISLDTRGLNLKGDLKYLSAKLSGKDFLFLEDSAKGQGKIEHIGSLNPVNQPQFKGDDVSFVFHPYGDSLIAQTGVLPLSMMETKGEFAGKIKLTPRGVSGAGNFKINPKLTKNVLPEMVSEAFAFENMRVKAELSEFSIADPLSQVNILQVAENYSALDLVRMVDSVQLHKNQINLEALSYRVQANSLLWQIEKGFVDMKLDNENDYNFYSTSADQDSLRFKAGKAVLNLVDRSVFASEVEPIKVADAEVFPKNAQITLKGRLIEPLKDAELHLGTEDNHHLLYAANVEIKSANNVQGKAKIDYISPEGKKTTLELQRVYYNDTLKTIAAEGRLAREDKFNLSDFFDFQGRYKVLAKEKGMFFNGQSSYRHACLGDVETPNYFSWQGFIDPSDLQLPLDTAKLAGKSVDIGTGLALNDRTLKFYPSFLQYKKDKKHVDVFAATGFLHHNADDNTIEITPEKNQVSLNTVGSVVSFAPSSCILQTQGKINLGLFYPYSTWQAFGEGEYQIRQEQWSAQASLLFQSPMLAQIVKPIIDRLNKIKTLESLSIRSANFEKHLRQITEKKNAEGILTQLSAKAVSKKTLPVNLQDKTFLATTSLAWEKAGSNMAYTSTDERLNLVALAGEYIFKKVKGKVMLIKTRQGSSDRMILYLAFSRDFELYLDYETTQEIMYLYTSDAEVNSQIEKLLQKQSAVPVVFGYTAYSVHVELPDDDKYYKRFRKEAINRYQDEETSSVEEPATPAVAPKKVSSILEDAED